MDASLTNSLSLVAAQATQQAVKSPIPGSSTASARKAAEDFESVFLTSMLESMFEGVKTDGPFGGGSSEKTYRSLLINEYAKQISQNGGLGIADQITRDLLALQEGAQK
mgnify:CR=1 FL=1